MPILARGKTDTGRILAYIRDDRPFSSWAPPAALYYASRNRQQKHPERGASEKFHRHPAKADAYGSYNPQFKVNRKPDPPHPSVVLGAFALQVLHPCRYHRRRKNAEPISPITLEAVRQIDALFDIDRKINGLSAAKRHNAPERQHANSRKFGQMATFRKSQGLSKFTCH